MSKPEHFDAVSFLKEKYEILADKLFRINKTVSECNGEYMTDVLCSLLIANCEEFFSDVVKCFILEEKFVFPHLVNVLPDQASPNAMKSEHDKFIRDFFSFKNRLQGSDFTKTSFNLFEPEIIKISDNFGRIIHKKSEIMYREMYSFLSEDELSNIYSNLKREPESF